MFEHQEYIAVRNRGSILRYSVLHMHMCTTHTGTHTVGWALIRIFNLLIPPSQCELYHWIDLLDKFDLILEQAAQEPEESKKTTKSEEHDTSCIFMCPMLEDPQASEMLSLVLVYSEDVRIKPLQFFLSKATIKVYHKEALAIIAYFLPGLYKVPVIGIACFS